jgi:hypothetical protein
MEAENTVDDLAQKHDGTAVTRERIQATVTYDIHLSEEKVDELPDDIVPEEFALNCAVSRVDAELDCQARKQRAVIEETGHHGKTVYTVMVSVDQ